MAEVPSISSRVLDGLVGAGLLTVEQLGSLRESAAADGRSPADVLVERGLVSSSDVSTVLEGEMGVPRVDLESYAPEPGALALMPAEVARRMRVLPLFEIEGMLTVAVGDPIDVFRLDSVAEATGLEIEPVLADPTAVGDAVDQYYSAGDAAPAVAPPRPAEPPAVVPEAEEAPETLGAFEAGELMQETASAEPAAPPQTVIEEVAGSVSAAPGEGIDLDVLAVADPTKVALLVSDILELAVKRGAGKIHLLPYKTDFFLVFRIGRALEKVSSAPLSMEAALIDGFKSYARLSSVPPTLPALGRLHARVGEKDVVVTVSVVPTVAGQRMVVTLRPGGAVPKPLGELGMSEAETRALQAMVERGRGLLLVCGPVAGGRSATYYALLSHAAAAGKTVYSVERAIEYEIPAVAQVLVNPGSPVGAASYFAAGMRQDTDVMAIDALQSVEDVHLSVEAAGMGKLVVATFAGGDVVSGVRRMLDLGAEPVSLAAALTVAVGQRLVRTNCPQCTLEQRDPLAEKIPGAPKGLVNKAGAGCAACANSGFGGVTGIFEVLPFTEPVRAQVAADAPLEGLAAAAKAAGMRPLAASGLAKVTAGLVSATELDRVLRFA